MTFIGIIKIIKGETTVGSLCKQQIVIRQDTNQICIDFLGDNVKLLSGFKEGDMVEVDVAFATNVAINGAIFNRVSGKTIKHST